jgi:hypothetical protein
MSTPALTWDDVDVWCLLVEIDDLKGKVAELEAQLAEAYRGRWPVEGGPPPEWDHWIMVLPLDGHFGFGACLGPSDAEDREAEAHRRARNEAELSWPRAKRRTWAA